MTDVEAVDRSAELNAVANPLVTIMIPTYSQAELVGKAVGSALAQDYPNLEVLLIDDASPDHTPDVAAGFGADPRFSYVRHAKNLGRVGTYRDGLYRLARGDYVLNLDGDDWLTDPRYLSSAMRLVAEHPDLSLVFARTATYHEATRTYTESELNRGLPAIIDGNTLLRGYVDETAGIPHLSAVYRRDVAITLEFYTEDVIGSDSVSFLKLLPGRRVGYIDEVVAAWRSHDANTTHRARARDAIQNFKVADVPAAYFISSGVLSTTEAQAWRRQMSARLGYRHLANFLVEGQMREALTFTASMIRSRPAATATMLGRIAARAARTLVGRRR